MNSPPWHRALTAWAAQYFPGEPLLVSAGDPLGEWTVARTADPAARERPIVVTPLAPDRSIMSAVQDAHRSPHPVVAVLDGTQWLVSLVRWRGPGQADLGSVIHLPRPSHVTSKQVDAVLRGARRPKRTKKKKK